MPHENIFTATIARAARFPFWLLARRPAFVPRKVLILKPCCLSQVMLTTPLLAALNEAYPQAQFDWAVSDWARPAIASNQRLTDIISTGPGSLHDQNWSEVYALAMQLQEQRYDTCIIPSRSSLLSLVAWWARIPQRVGLHLNGRGFAHTLAVKPPRDVQHEAAVLLSLASALGVSDEIINSVGMEFYPPDTDRTTVTQRLVGADWLGDAPLVIVHPGGGINPTQPDPIKQWPVERYVLLISHIIRRFQARVVLVGSAADRPLAVAIQGMLSVPLFDLAGKINLAELGALCEVANLFIGNDSGPTHVAAAVGCQTVAIFGPSDPAISKPYATKGKVVALWREGRGERPFSWEDGVTVPEAIEAVNKLLTV